MYGIFLIKHSGSFYCWFCCVTMGIAVLTRCSYSLLDLSGVVYVCPVGIQELTCTVADKFHQWTVTAPEIREKSVSFSVNAKFAMKGVPLPQSSRAPGITVTPISVSSELLSSRIAIDMENYDIHNQGPVYVECAGDNAELRELSNDLYNNVYSHYAVNYAAQDYSVNCVYMQLADDSTFTTISWSSLGDTRSRFTYVIFFDPNPGFDQLFLSSRINTISLTLQASVTYIIEVRFLECSPRHVRFTLRGTIS